MSKIFNIELKSGGFNKAQARVLKALHAAAMPMSIRRLEETLDLKRLTIYYNLKQLARRGFVRQDRTGRIYTWILEPLETSAGSVDIPIERAHDVLARSSSQKLWGIQGGETVRVHMEKILRGTTYKSIHHRQRLRQVIIDGILTAKGVELIKDMPKSELSTHLHRPTILHVTKDVPELDTLEIISDGKMLIVIDHEKGKATMIRNSFIIVAYLALHESIKALSTKMRPQEVYGDLK